MKILDYKFLIVIGLTVIVYFLFREIENYKAANDLTLGVLSTE